MEFSLVLVYCPTWGNLRWFSPAQSVLVAGDRVFLLPKTFACFEMGPPREEEERSLPLPE
jgi:hypothetical protein